MVDIADLETRRIAHARRSAHANRTAWLAWQHPAAVSPGVRVRLAQVLRSLATWLDPPLGPGRHEPRATPLAL
jgi:hypothetical protein